MSSPADEGTPAGKAQGAGAEAASAGMSRDPGEGAPSADEPTLTPLTSLGSLFSGALDEASTCEADGTCD